MVYTIYGEVFKIVHKMDDSIKDAIKYFDGICKNNEKSNVIQFHACVPGDVEPAFIEHTSVKPELVSQKLAVITHILVSLDHLFLNL